MIQSRLSCEKPEFTINKAAKNTVKRGASLAAVLLCLSGMSACVSLLPEAAPADIVYRLHSTDIAVNAIKNAPTVRIDRPVVATALRGKDIIVSQANGSLSSAMGAQWADPVPTLIQRSLFNVLAGEEGVIGVLPNSGARPQYRVSLNVVKFEAHFDRGQSQAPLAIANYSVVLSDASSRDLIGTYSVNKSVRATAGRVSSIVSAKSQANQQALDEISDWVMGELTIGKRVLNAG